MRAGFTERSAPSRTRYDEQDRYLPLRQILVAGFRSDTKILWEPTLFVFKRIRLSLHRRQLRLTRFSQTSRLLFRCFLRANSARRPPTTTHGPSCVAGRAGTGDCPYQDTLHLDTAQPFQPDSGPRQSLSGSSAQRATARSLARRPPNRSSSSGRFKRRREDGKFRAGT